MIRERDPIDRRRLTAMRAIRETEAFFSECLRNPDQVRRIPTVRIGFGSFPPGLADEFWKIALGIS